MRILYLKYILDQEDDSILKKFLNLQFEKPVRKDWASTVMCDLKELEINISLEEIKNMTKTKFLRILKVQIKKKAFSYLIRKRGGKRR